MANWISVGPASHIPEGGWQIINLDDSTEVAVFNLNGSFYAIEDVCTHDGGTLVGGLIEGDQIICPRHGARFCIKTGAVMAPPAYEPIKTFEVRVVNNRVEVFNPY